MKVHLVDGTYELFRAYYGSPAALSEKGEEVGATRGFLRSLYGLLTSRDVTHVAVAFDQVIESFRNDLFAGYKTGDGIEPKLWSQFPLAERAAQALGIVSWPMVEFETDDALATGAHRFEREKSVTEVRICSPDKDFAQCVHGTRVVMWDRMRDKLYDHAGVVEKWGVLPESIPDYLALVGDSADGIPGISRWGAKSASTVLKHYVHLEAIPDRAEAWAVKVRGADALAETLSSARDEATLYRRLATLRTDVPLKEGLSELRWVQPNWEALRALCAEIRDDRFFERVRSERS